jgi:hypothetical protein
MVASLEQVTYNQNTSNPIHLDLISLSNQCCSTLPREAYPAPTINGHWHALHRILRAEHQSARG